METVKVKVSLNGSEVIADTGIEPRIWRKLSEDEQVKIQCDIAAIECDIEVIEPVEEDFSNEFELKRLDKVLGL